MELAIGRYIRENEDLVVAGTPPLVLRRTYYSGWRAPAPFGIGTTQAADWFVVGDGKTFQSAGLVRPGQAQLRFEPHVGRQHRAECDVQALLE